MDKKIYLIGTLAVLAAVSILGTMIVFHYGPFAGKISEPLEITDVSVIAENVKGDSTSGELKADFLIKMSLKNKTRYPVKVSQFEAYFSDKIALDFYVDYPSGGKITMKKLAQEYGVEIKNSESISLSTEVILMGPLEPGKTLNFSEIRVYGISEHPNYENDYENSNFGVLAKHEDGSVYIPKP